MRILLICLLSLCPLGLAAQTPSLEPVDEAQKDESFMAYREA